ncbi:Panacea domain-containing protein [Parasedimentitalea huanghaiensis]|uniref:DUF4065 domain-containing protein n=1 Tax=Parasedimentitalea huanghaiensis TaxID=2682100 RepID=A0A6L6WLB9_9RHOB|nr:type II toxin-antitoxin system antitoxin SocA domain-containing protein [Zongyanglinia huanghaiensis]MVO18130.1 DUF4065 domain-containing protein [Zongyanglinia huanghaiensis]
MYDARQVANWFVRKAALEGRQLSIMSLLKLTYIAHGWHLEMRKAPLFGNRIEAWQRGPVIPDVYHAFRGQGVQISQVAGSAAFDAGVNSFDEDFLQQIYSIYGHMDAFKLSDITHESGGPWEKASRRGHYALMFDDEIREHYEGKRSTAST